MMVQEWWIGESLQKVLKYIYTVNVEMFGLLKFSSFPLSHAFMQLTRERGKKVYSVTVLW